MQIRLPTPELTLPCNTRIREDERIVAEVAVFGEFWPGYEVVRVVLPVVSRLAPTAGTAQRRDCAGTPDCRSLPHGTPAGRRKHTGHLKPRSI